MDCFNHENTFQFPSIWQYLYCQIFGVEFKTAQLHKTGYIPFRHINVLLVELGNMGVEHF
jgi:hypothetical protein